MASKSTSPSKSIATKAVIRLGRDEMNLVEYPFASLRLETRGGDERVGTMIEKKWLVPHPNHPGRELDAGWSVSGHPELGLPTASEERLYLVMMELTHQEGWHQTVHFSPAQILDRLGAVPNSRAYVTLRLGFARLKAMSVLARHCFWDNSGQRLIDTVGFSVIDDFTLDLMVGRKKTGLLPLSSWKWSDTIFASMQANYIRQIDLDFALSLDRPLAMRLYRYLDKKRYSKAGPRSGYTEGLQNLCDKHLGLADTRFPSVMKRTLDAAHAELIARGFLKSAAFEPLASGKGLKVVYRFGDKILPKNTKSGAVTSPAPEVAPTNSKPAPADEWTRRCRACDAAIERIEREDPDVYAQMQHEALEDLGEFARARLNREPDSPGVAFAIHENLRCATEIAFAWMIEEEKQRLLLREAAR